MIQKIPPLFLWLAAFLCALFFVNDWQLELFASAVILIFIWSVFSLGKNKEWRVPSSWVLKIMAAFWLLVFLSVLGSDILSVSLMSFCLFSMLPLTFFVFMVNASEKDFVFVAKVLAVIYVGLSFWALIQIFALSDHFKGRATHPLANPNSLAALFSLGFLCAVGWVLGAKENLHRFCALVLSAFLFAGMMAAGSRGAFFAVIPVLALFLLLMRGLVRENIRSVGALVVVCTVLFFLTSFGINEGNNLFDRVVGGQLQDFNSFTSNRLSLWLASLEMIKIYGVFGTGIGTYFLYFPEFRLSDDPFGAYYAHSDPIQYWAELGVLGLILFYAFIVSVIGRTVQAVKKSVSNQERLLILTPFFALAAVIIHTHVTFNLYNLSILFGVGFLLSVWFYATQQVLKTPEKIISFSKKYSIGVRFIFIALPFLLIGSMFFAYISGEHYTNKARDYLMAGELEPFATNVLLAQKLGMDGNYRPYLLAVNVPLSVLEEGGDKLSLEKRQDLTKIALGYLQHVRHINPRSSSALFYMGKLKEIGESAALPDTLNSADIYYTQALKIDPLHIGARLALAKIYEDAGEQAQALGVLEQGAQYKYASMNAMNLYSTLVRYYLENGNVEGRNSALKKMQHFQKRIENQKRINSQTLKQTLGQHLWKE